MIKIYYSHMYPSVWHVIACIFPIYKLMLLYTISYFYQYFASDLCWIIHCLKMPQLKGKYSPYFEFIVDNPKSKKYLKCKLYSDGTVLSYHGNTSVMKSHLEAKHNAEYRSLVGGMCCKFYCFQTYYIPCFIIYKAWISSSTFK